MSFSANYKRIQTNSYRLDSDRSRDTYKSPFSPNKSSTIKKELFISNPDTVFSDYYNIENYNFNKNKANHSKSILNIKAKTGTPNLDLLKNEISVKNSSIEVLKRSNYGNNDFYNNKRYNRNNIMVESNLNSMSSICSSKPKNISYLSSNDNNLKIDNLKTLNHKKIFDVNKIIDNLENKNSSSLLVYKDKNITSLPINKGTFIKKDYNSNYFNKKSNYDAIFNKREIYCSDSIQAKINKANYIEMPNQ